MQHLTCIIGNLNPVASMDCLAILNMLRDQRTRAPNGFRHNGFKISALDALFINSDNIIVHVHIEMRHLSFSGKTIYRALPGSAIM
ncbi:hypothetical protein NI18_21615 [Sphingomonas sp. Ant20]|nr:hypothetical protein NI18_21615 [Sphingomonas sp. Ant20]